MDRTLPLPEAGPGAPAAPAEGAGGIDVTVVLPVRNEERHLGAVLADVLGQEYPRERVEVLVVDGRSDDGTRAVVERAARADGRVRLLDNPQRRSSGARALGAAAARGRYVVFVDGHCRIPSRTWLRDTVDLFEQTGAACLARPQPLEADGAAGLRARAIAAARTSPLGHSARSTIFGLPSGPVSPVSAGAAYRRWVFQRVGTFDTTFDAAEDVEFNWRVERAGLSCWTSPRLAVAYAPRTTLRGLFRQMFRYGLGRARLHRKHPSAFTWETLVPVAFVLGLPFLAAAPLLPGVLRSAAIAPYALYAALVGVASVAAAVRRGLALLPLLPAAFLTIHLGLGLGYLRGRLRLGP